MIPAAPDPTLAAHSNGHIRGFSYSFVVFMALILKKVCHAWHRRTMKGHKNASIWVAGAK
jgi:hypothetical protein